jgi:tetratricopeptide (TPR) repeat protein
MAKAARVGGILSIFIILSFALAAQSGTLVVDQARVLYNSGSFQKAYDLIDVSITPRTQDENLKKSAAMQLVVMGISEWDMLNYRNAYASFKKAVDLQPDNPHPVATQYKREIESTMDVSSLKNKDEAGTTGPTAKTPDVQALINKVWAEEQRLSQAEKAQTAQKENATLKAQLDQQRSLNDETIQILKRIAEKGVNPTIVIQPDPALQALTTVMGDQTRILKSGSWTSILTIIVLIVLGLIILAILAFFAILVVKSRRPRAAGESANPFLNPALPGVSQEALAGPQRPLLEYLASNPENADEAEIQKLAQRAGRLSLMIEEAKTGGQGWDAVRSHMDELDGELKSEILTLVEDKLEQGELPSNQAILPVIFPFLTDYDDYLRERAEKLAAAALQESGESVDPGPFGMKALLAIPERLKAVLGGRDQSLATARLSRSIARQLGFSSADCQSLYKAAIAHDAGYLMLDAETLGGILSKTDLTDEEFSLIKTHTLKSQEYFHGLEVPDDIRDAMLYHHERNDGSGYPNGLKKDQIPLFARVIGVAESFTALIASRPHREKLEKASALAIIRDARAKFDHDIVEALAAVVKSGGARK